ncbi:aminotransferase class I/II-fold pyridoxal phosphate-dependent enzyme [Aliikangiella coralliicola]|uniref:histidinol-phosphate transaminase n=1 Tax=Aliikangiella coralliicola TaxID=2592383 RepID=A0A545UH00_9GAMM|nr:aminotransferase class I/II-fold pyridoxal phosphate-dependent enzyme [Aliikangiella coralliicola]TQV88747.1 aminotransferase class I/II-fold pyridoxal phosphate-dependent enzyme [Aliikangiella coralliicola]
MSNFTNFSPLESENSDNKSEEPGTLKLDFNERSDQISPLIETLPFGKTLWRYPERQRLEAKLAELNDLQPEQVLCTNGGDEAIMLLMRIVKETGSVILPLPAFSQYTWGVESWQLNKTLIPAKADLAIDIQATQQAIKANPKAVTIITRPNNPTGEMIPLGDLLNLVETAQAVGGWIFLDEAYIEFSEEQSAVYSLLNQYDNLVVLRTFSKAYGLAGIRLGYLLGSKKLIKEFEQRCMPFNVAEPSLQIGIQALSVENRKDATDYCKTIIRNRQQITGWLVEAGFSLVPSQANFVMIKLPPNQAKAIQSFLAKNGILVRSFQSDELINCLRITIPYNTKRLFDKLKQALWPDLICLDMDGVLIDTSNSYDESVKATVLELAGEKISQADIDRLKDTGGFNNDWVLTQKLLENLGLNFELQQVIDVFQRLYLGENNDGLVTNEERLISDRLIARINESQNCRFAIVTGRPRNEAIAGQQMLNLQRLDLISLDDVEKPKPSPEGIQKLQNKYSSFSWMCGDNPDDMKAANASNSLAVGIGERNAAALYQAGADIVLKNINELEAWLCQRS